MAYDSSREIIIIIKWERKNRKKKRGKAKQGQSNPEKENK
jgi:hypothetical protein